MGQKNTNGTVSLAGHDVPRRTLVQGAAWSVPVIAAAVAAPMASASGAADATIAAQVGGDITVNDTEGTASGALNGGLVISQVEGTWQTGELNGVLRLTGPWATGSITKADGSPFVLNEQIDVSGVLWTVYQIDEDASGTYAVYVTSPSRGISVDWTFRLPSAIYSGTYTPGVPTVRNPIAATVSVAAANVNNGNSVANSSPYPA